MKSQLHSQLQVLSEQIFDLKEKCSDLEYKNLMDALGKIYAEQNLARIEEEGVETNEHSESDQESEPEIQRTLERPLRGTKEWCLLSVATKALYLGMTVEEFIADEKRKLHWADEAFYKEHPQHLPVYLKKQCADEAFFKEHPQYLPSNINKKQEKNKADSGCIIC